MVPSLVDEKVRATIRKNTATSYGLALIIGLPFQPEICNAIQRVQRQLEALVPARFTWYDRDHLHATLVASLRGRYREHPPLQREQLPSDLDGFTRDLGDFFARLQPFPLELSGVHITEEGSVMVAENTPMQQLASRLRRYPELDQPKHLKGLHVAIGFLNTCRPFSTEEERRHFEEGFAQIMDIPIGRMMVRQVWLVHYANRTLNRIIGRVPFTLGCSNSLTAERLLQDLGVSVSKVRSGS